jgi:hypothetical protein
VIPHVIGATVTFQDATALADHSEGESPLVSRRLAERGDSQNVQVVLNAHAYEFGTSHSDISELLKALSRDGLA